MPEPEFLMFMCPLLMALGFLVGIVLVIALAVDRLNPKHPQHDRRERSKVTWHNPSGPVEQKPENH
ncbi:hypothetical protein [Longispora urticae]